MSGLQQETLWFSMLENGGCLTRPSFAGKASPGLEVWKRDGVADAGGMARDKSQRHFMSSS